MCGRGVYNIRVDGMVFASSERYERCSCQPAVCFSSSHSSLDVGVASSLKSLSSRRILRAVSRYLQPNAMLADPSRLRQNMSFVLELG